MNILAPGTLVGKYPVVSVLSTGGMGVIYEAAHPVLGTRVVIKTVLPNMAGNAALADRFRNEALAASRIRDDRLPQIFDIDRLEDNTQYMVMEFLYGEDLQKRLALGALTPSYAVRIMFEVLEVLHKVHQLGIIHRDITPRNIFLARSDLFGEIPKLLDFGVAHFVDDPNTRPGEVVGSPFYMAPEQVQSRNQIGPWTDVFAAGVVLFEMLAGPGIRPWPTANLVGYLTALAIRQPPRHLNELVPGLPSALTDAVMKAIRFEVEERFADAISFAQEIEPFAAPRATLHNLRAAAKARTSAPPPDPSEEKTQLENDATVAVIATSRTTEIKPRPGAKMLAGIASQLAVLAKKTGAAAAPRMKLRPGERRHMSVLLMSVVLEEPREHALDSEDADQLNDQIVALFEQQLDGFGGHAMPPLGGSVMATFGYEHVSEDDAERAVFAATALLDKRHEINATLTEIGYVVNLRIGVHTGFVTRGRDDGRDDVAGGLTVNTAKLLERNAPLNGVLVSRETLDLLGGRFSERPFAKLVLKGRADPVEAFEVLGPADLEGRRWGRAGVFPTARFVGRDHELHELKVMFDRAVPEVHGPESMPADSLNPAARAVLFPAESFARAAQKNKAAKVPVCVITGAPGIGKSRLVHEFLRSSQADAARKTQVLFAEPASKVPYGVWVALLQQLFLTPGGTRFDAMQVIAYLGHLAMALDEPRRSELTSQANVVSFLLGLGCDELSDSHSPSELQGRIQQTIALTIEAIGRQCAEQNQNRPAILVLDNLQRADEASLSMLGRVISAVRSPYPPLFILTARDAESLQSIEQANTNARNLHLEALGPEDVLSIAQGIAGCALSPDAERLVQERAAGNPLFVEELVVALRDQNIAGADAASLRTYVPTSLFGLILSRVDRLGPELGTALRYASVLGTEFAAPLFDAVVSALEDERTQRRHLSELVRRGILESHFDQREEVFAFRQVMVQGAVYGTVLRENKRVLHKLAAEAIERTYAGRLEPHLNALFHHYSQTDEMEKMVHYARLSGSRAVALGAFSDSIEMLLLAENFRTRLPNDEPTAAAKTLYDLATALFWLGRMRDAAERASQAQGILAGDDRQKSVTQRARACLLLSEAEYQQARYSDAAEHLKLSRALFLKAERPYDAAQAECTLGFQLRASGRLEEGLSLAKKGWQQLKDSGNLAAIVRAGHDLGNVLRDVGELDAALSVFEHAILAGHELRKEGNSAAALWGMLAARSGRGMTYAAMGRLDEAIADQRAVYALSVQENNPLAQVSAGFHLANHLVEKGELLAAEQAALRALRLCGELGLSARELKCRLLLAQIDEKLGKKAESLRHWDAAEALARKNQVSDEAWLDIAEPFSMQLAASGGSAVRMAELIREAEVRLSRSGSANFRSRAALFLEKTPEIRAEGGSSSTLRFGTEVG